ncbi:MAG TPA: hypothetical protein PK402_10470, partial [Tepidisphaeraceae bacterium]|nr:hypothetical protein [Tepidisphaeraceae bacterium]
MRFRLLATIALLAFASAVRADTLVLKTGAKLEGDLKRVDGGWEVVLADGRVQFVAAEEVKSVVLAPAGRLTENVAQERLASLRRSVEAEKTIERIIQRYEQFVLTSQNTQAGASAEADLQMWRDRLEKKFVRYGRVWMLPEDRLKVIRESVSMIEKIQVLAQAGHFAEEQALIDEQLAKNPSDISFIYLDGVLKLRQGEFGAARKSFEAVSRVAREHAPTLNNLAAAHFGLRRETGAINPLDRALQAAPGVQALIDNAAELLHTLDRTPPRNLPTDRLLRRFAEQDRALQQQMQQKGLYRWGSSWVEETKIKELQAIQKEID